MSEDVKQPVIYRGDLRKVYLDPLVGPRELLAYIPEQHASRSCERALRGGTDKAAADRHAPWCDLCVTANKATAGPATPRRNPWGTTAAAPSP